LTHPLWKGSLVRLHVLDDGKVSNTERAQGKKDSPPRYYANLYHPKRKARMELKDPFKPCGLKKRIKWLNAGFTPWDPWGRLNHTGSHK